MISTFVAKFTHKPIQEVQEYLIGCKVTEIDEEGRFIRLENEKGEAFYIDNTGKKPVASALSTNRERLGLLEDFFSALLDKLDISEEELLDILKD
jgi:hypothetical protein